MGSTSTETPDSFDALERLATSIRRLIAVTVAVQAPQQVLADAADAIERTVTELQRHVTDPPPPRYAGNVDPTHPSSVFRYDLVTGCYNPLAAPLDIRWAEPRAVGRVCFGTPYEGFPGCVHGGVIAASFDQVLYVANLMRGVAGPTAKLELRYLRPTPLHTDLRFEAWVDRVEERTVHTIGRLWAADAVTVEASGLYVLLPPERAMGMLSE
jgi:acyl-CoA thioesterase FadM